MGRRLRQAKAIPKKLLEKWRPQLFEGPLERSPAAKSKPGFVAAAPPKRRQTHQCDQRRRARGVSKSKWLQVPNRQRCPTASACFSDKRDKLQPFSGARGFGVVVGTLASFVVCRRPAAMLSRASDRPDAQPRSDCQVKSRCTMKAPVRDVNICWASTRPLPHAIF